MVGIIYSRWLWIIPFVLGISVAVVTPAISSDSSATSPLTQEGTSQQSTADTSTPAPTPDLKWSEFTDPTQGYRYALAMTRLVVTTTPVSATDGAIPPGKGRLMAAITVQSRGQGSSIASPQFYFGLPKSASWEYQLDATGHLSCYNGSPSNKPDYCWNSEKDMRVGTDGSTTSYVRLTGGETVDVVLGNDAATMIPSSVLAHDVLLGVNSSPTTNPAPTMVVLDAPQ